MENHLPRPGGKSRFQQFLAFKRLENQKFGF